MWLLKKLCRTWNSSSSYCQRSIAIKSVSIRRHRTNRDGVHLQLLQGLPVLSQFQSHPLPAVLWSGPQTLLDLRARSWISYLVVPGGGGADKEVTSSQSRVGLVEKGPWCGCPDLSPVTGSVALSVTRSRHTSSVTSKKKTLSRYTRAHRLGVCLCVCVFPVCLRWVCAPVGLVLGLLEAGGLLQVSREPVQNPPSAAAVQAAQTFL